MAINKLLNLKPKTSTGSHFSPSFLHCLWIYMLSYNATVFTFSGDAYGRTPRSPWPSSEYRVLKLSCLPCTDGEQLKRGKMSLWKQQQSWSLVKLELEEKQSKCTLVHGCVYFIVSMCASVRACERGKVAGYFILKLITLITETSVYVGLNACKLLDWLCSRCQLAADWVDVFCSLHVCLCVWSQGALGTPGLQGPPGPAGDAGQRVSKRFSHFLAEM